MKLKALLLVTLSVLANAAEQPVTTVLGTLETRPSWDSLTGVFRTENSIEAGARLSEKVTLTYLQAVNTNIYNPSLPDAQGGLGAKLDVGFIRTRVSGLYNNENGLSLSFQNRAYLPVNEYAQTTGNVLTLRNYFNLTQKVSDVVTFTVSEIPIFFVNSKAGNGADANTVFENRVYLVADFQITEALSFSFPLMFHQTRKAGYAPSKNSDAWVHFVWIYPEFTYQIDPNYRVGVAYYNNANLVADDFSSLQIGKGLENGAYQLVFAASL